MARFSNDAARRLFSDTRGADIGARFDCRTPDSLIRDLHVETDQGRLSLARGGRQRELTGELVIKAEKRECHELDFR